MHIYHLEFDGSRSGGLEFVRTEGKDTVKQAVFVILPQKYKKNYPHNLPVGSILRESHNFSIDRLINSCIL